jgi:iron complex outermembrane recepter protein
MRVWWFADSIRLGSIVALSGSLVSVLALPGLAQVSAYQGEQAARGIEGSAKPRLTTNSQQGVGEARRRHRPATTVAEWLAQSPSAIDSQLPTQIAGVRLNPSKNGIELILETTNGEPLQILTSSYGQTFVANIPNSQLALPEGKAFRADNPAVGIATVTVTQPTASGIRVSVIGKTGVPTTRIVQSIRALVFNLSAPVAPTVVNPTVQPPQLPLSQGETVKPQPPTKPEQVTPAPATPQQPTKPAPGGEEIEIVVTGEQEGYRIPDASIGTKTDTPLRDIPASIQIVPQQVLQERQARSIADGLENVSGVAPITGPAGTRNYFTIRGFAYNNFLVNGIPDSQISSDGSFANIERLEVLKGPASVLYGETGEGSIGGLVNFVTKQPLRDPFYEVSVSAARFDDYQGIIDFSGPLNDSKTVLYRFIASYRNSESFIDFNESQEFFVAPTLSFSLGQNTDLIVEGDVNAMERNGQQPYGVPAVGTVLPNPNGEIDRSFNPTGPQTDNLTINGRVGYRLEHRFNQNWKLRNAFRYTFYDDDDRDGAPSFSGESLAEDNRTLNRAASVGSQFYDFYYLSTDLLGEFRTGSIDHQLLFGFSLSRNEIELTFEQDSPAAPVDIFNPVFDQTFVRSGILETDSLTTRDTLGIYLQDQIALAENLKLLLGGRVDFFEERALDRLADEETTQSDTAFSPRVGIVYQPIPAISLYGSFTRSFSPSIGVSASGDPFVPERGKQYEVGIKADVNDRLSATLALYDLTRSNVTSTDPEDPDFSIQTGEQNSQGIELDVRGEILPGWNIIGGYAYTDAKVTEDTEIPVGNRLYLAPEHMFNLWTSYKIQTGSLQGLGFGLGFSYIGERPGDLENSFDLPSYFRTDAAIFYERDAFRAALNFRNLFDVEYYSGAYSIDRVFRGDPFTVQGTVSWQF